MAIVLLATGIDFAVRVALDFNMSRIAIAEAVLFASVSAFLAWSATTSPLESTAMVRVEWVVIAASGLASIRAGMLAARLPVVVANLVTLLMAALVSVGWYILGRCNSARRISGSKSQSDCLL